MHPALVWAGREWAVAVLRAAQAAEAGQAVDVAEAQHAAELLLLAVEGQPFVPQDAAAPDHIQRRQAEQWRAERYQPREGGALLNALPVAQRIVAEAVRWQAQEAALDADVQQWGRVLRSAQGYGLVRRLDAGLLAGLGLFAYVEIEEKYRASLALAFRELRLSDGLQSTAERVSEMSEAQLARGIQLALVGGGLAARDLYALMAEGSKR
jgi:hypothetical protein